MADGLVSTDRLVDACRSLEADLLCLQEVDRDQARSGGMDQTAAIGEGMGAAAWRFEPALVGEPGGRWRPAGDGDQTGDGDQGGKGDMAGGDGDHPGDGPEPAYGVGIVSRLAVEAWHVLRLRAARVRSPVAVPGGKGRFILLPDEPRVVLAADLGRLLVATTHLSFVPGYNLVQVRRAARWLEGFGRPAVLLGDLNAPGPLPRWASRWRRLAVARTYPADRPSLSDHRALVVELRG